MLVSMKYIQENYGISRITLINWEKKGVLKAYRTPGGVRRYKKEDIEKLLGLYDEKQQEQKGKTICYARVSTKKQEEYLQNQVKRLLEYCKQKGYRNIEVISEIASGVNENRRGLTKLLNKVRNGEVERVVIECEDRLARFGFKYLKRYIEDFGVRLEVVNEQEESDETLKELTDDLVAIVVSFASRIYGKRGGRHEDNSS